MYVPAAFAEHDRAKLFELMEQYSFALLISQQDGEPFATHLPLLVKREQGPNGSLLGHMARANPQWRQAEGQTVLALFSGPHAYVSPTWYESENVVPTWNYVAVHAYGTFRAVQNERETLEIVRNTVDVYEAAMPVPWKMDVESEFNRKLIQAVVGFRIEISRVEGKWKLNQNHPKERREKVVRALKAMAANDQNATAVAELMTESLHEETQRR